MLSRTDGLCKHILKCFLFLLTARFFFGPNWLDAVRWQNRGDTLSRQPAGAPGGLEVVAADGAVEVEHFAGQVQAGNQLALHVAGTDFGKRDASGGELC